PLTPDHRRQRRNHRHSVKLHPHRITLPCHLPRGYPARTFLSSIGVHMPSNRKFRFGVQTSNAPTRENWIEKARKIEDLGYSTLFIPEHFNNQLAPAHAM